MKNLKFVFFLVLVTLLAGTTTEAFAGFHQSGAKNLSALRRIGSCHHGILACSTSVKNTSTNKLAIEMRMSTPLWNLGSSSALGAASTDDGELESSDDDDASAEKLTFRERLAKALPQKDQDGEKLSFRERLAKMGLACVLSYGFVSNLNAGITTGLSWFVFAKRVRWTTVKVV